MIISLKQRQRDIEVVLKGTMGEPLSTQWKSEKISKWYQGQINFTKKAKSLKKYDLTKFNNLSVRLVYQDMSN